MPSRSWPGDHVGRVLGQHPVAGLGLAQGDLVALAVGDVLGRGVEAPLVRRELRGPEQPAVAAVLGCGSGVSKPPMRVLALEEAAMRARPRGRRRRGARSPATRRPTISSGRQPSTVLERRRHALEAAVEADDGASGSGPSPPRAGARGAASARPRRRSAPRAGRRRRCAARGRARPGCRSPGRPAAAGRRRRSARRGRAVDPGVGLRSAGRRRASSTTRRRVALDDPRGRSDTRAHVAAGRARRRLDPLAARRRRR